MLKAIRTLAMGAALAAVAYTSAVADDWQNVVDAAKSEGKVVLYLAKSDGQAKALLDAFKQKYGIEGVWLRGAARAQLTKLNGEISAGAIQSDVFYTAGPASHASAAKNTPVWMPNGPNAQNWPSQYIYPHGSVQVAADPVVIVYNTNAVTPPPADYNDIVGKGYIQAVGSPTSAFRAAYFEHTRKFLGDEYWQKVAADGIVTGPSVNALIQGVAAGESDTSLAFAWQAAELKNANAPIDWAVPTSGAWALTQWAMALEKGPNPNAGKLLLDFMMSPEGQEILNTDGGVSVLDGGAMPKDVDEESLSAEDVVAITKWWETTFRQAAPQ